MVDNVITIISNQCRFRFFRTLCSVIAKYRSMIAIEIEAVATVSAQLFSLPPRRLADFARKSINHHFPLPPSSSSSTRVGRGAGGATASIIDKELQMAIPHATTTTINRRRILLFLLLLRANFRQFLKTRLFGSNARNKPFFRRKKYGKLARKNERTKNPANLTT